MVRIPSLVAIAFFVSNGILFPTRVQAQLSIVAILDQTNPTSTGFWLEKGALWWALNSDYVVVDQQLDRESLQEHEYYLLIEQAPDHTERIYPVEGSRIFKVFNRQAPNRPSGIYIYRIKKCNESICEFVSGTLSGPLVVFDDRRKSVSRDHEFIRLPDLVIQVLNLTEHAETSEDLQRELNSLRSMHLNDDKNFIDMYKIARRIAATEEYQTIILGSP